MFTTLSSSLEGLDLLFEQYKKQIDEKIKLSIDDLGPKNELRNACQYSLTNGGKRFRPAIVFMVAEALALKFDVSDAALAVEYFHCASLIADDLPCMDDDNERREKPSLHKVYGETIALLTTYALIAAGYERLQLNADLLKRQTSNENWAHQVCVLALGNASYNTGILGATGGQFLDLFSSQPTHEIVTETIRLKTVSLFEISFVLGWLYGGGDVSSLDKVKKLSYHFGMAFQIADDLNDLEEDLLNNRAINMACLVGKEKAIAQIQEEISRYFQLLQELKIDTSPLKGLGLLVLKVLSGVSDG